MSETFVHEPVGYKLLAAFEGRFKNKQYLHRQSTHGDWVAMHIYEDLNGFVRSPKLQERISHRERVLNVQNRRRGIEARRGDGTFGEAIPGVPVIADPGFTVARGPIATVEIGTEVKILAKAMMKQLDRVIGDLVKQVDHFKRGGGAGHPICVGIVGINYSSVYTSYEKDRVWQTDGRQYPHPIQEAPQAETRLITQVRPVFDELLVLRFRATNVPPYPFEWVNFEATAMDYGAALVRISREYERRF